MDLSLIDYSRLSGPPDPQPGQCEARDGEDPAGERSAEEERLCGAHQ